MQNKSTPLQEYNAGLAQGAKILQEQLAADHKTEHQKEAKLTAKARGRAGRFRGKVKAKQNNKARGGKMAR